MSERCAATNGVGWYCRNTGKHEFEGAMWCRLHHPPTVEERRKWKAADLEALAKRRADALECLREIFRHVPDVLEVGNGEVVVEMCVPDELWQRARKIARGE